MVNIQFRTYPVRKTAIKRLSYILQQKNVFSYLSLIIPPANLTISHRLNESYTITYIFYTISQTSYNKLYK